MSASKQHNIMMEALRIALVAVFYFVVAKLGLQLAFVNPSASPIWPATGVAIAAVLLWGYRIAPAIFIGAFVANQLTAGSLFTSCGIAVGNTLEALAAGYLIQRFGGGEQIFDDATGVARFAIIAVLATAISAALGTLSLALGGYIESHAPLYVGLTWWLGDLAGALVVTPVVLLWGRGPKWTFEPQSLTSPSLVLPYLGAALVGFVAFTPSIPPLPIRDLLGFVTILPLLWSALPDPAAHGYYRADFGCVRSMGHITEWRALRFL
jgi:integral membrane sensor domain MASE1